jgi:hypothetical protein
MLTLFRWILLVPLLATLLPPGVAQAQPMATGSWKYQTIDTTATALRNTPEALIDQLNKQGAQGWELSVAVGSQLLFRQPTNGGLAWEYLALDVSKNLYAGDLANLSSALNPLEREGWEATLLLGPYLLLKRPAFGGGPWEHLLFDGSSLLGNSNPRMATTRLGVLGGQGWELSLVAGTYMLFKRPVGSAQRYEYLRDDSAADLATASPTAVATLASLGNQGFELKAAAGNALLFQRAISSTISWEHQSLDLSQALRNPATARTALNNQGKQGYEPAISLYTLLILKRPMQSLITPTSQSSAVPQATAVAPTRAPTTAATRTPAPTGTRAPTTAATRTPAPTATRAPTTAATRTATPTTVATRTPAPTRSPVPTPVATRTVSATRPTETAQRAASAAPPAPAADQSTTLAAAPTEPAASSAPAANQPTSSAERPPVIFVASYRGCSEAILGIRPRWEAADPAAENNVARTALLPVVADQLGYGQLVRQFLASGFELSRNLFVFCPHWAESMPVAADRFAETVRRAAAASKDDPPVTIITHGDGGLIARYYLQRDAATSREFVRDLIMLAPPNRGMASTYYLLEGGDMRGEPASLRWLTRLALVAHCVHLRDQSEPTELNPQQQARCLRTGTLAEGALEATSSTDDALLLAAWLLADDAFLDDGDRQRAYPNAPIRRLNDAPQVEALFAGLQGGVTILAGAIDRSTIARIPVRPRNIADGPLWSYGRPDSTRDPELAAGDGQVLVESTKLQAPVGTAYKHEIIWGSDHYGLLKNVEVHARLAEILGVELMPSTQAGPNHAEESSKLLLAAVWAPVELIVHDPQGRACGIGESGTLQRDIPTAYYGVSTTENGPKVVLVPQAEVGTYRVDVRGVDIGKYVLHIEQGAADQPLLVANGETKQGETRTYLAQYQPVQAEAETGRPPLLQFFAIGALLVAFLILVFPRKR